MPTLLPPTKRRKKPSLLRLLDFAGIGVVVLFAAWCTATSLSQGVSEAIRAVEYFAR